MPPRKVDSSTRAAPARKTYQLSRFSRGNATSRAPIMIGRRKLPNADGMDGIKKSQTMITPCRVNMRL